MRASLKINILLIIILFSNVIFAYGQSASDQFARNCYTKGVKYAVKGFLSEAKDEFEKALYFDPNYESAKRAVKIVQDALNQNIKNATVNHLLKGFGYEEKELWDHSISEFSLAIEINPRYSEAYCFRSIIYLVSGQYENTIFDCNTAIKINPNCAWAYNNRGIAHGQGKGQHEKAIADFTKAIELNPVYADAYNNRGLVYAIKGQLDMACSDWRRAWELGLSYTYELAKRIGDCK